MCLLTHMNNDNMLMQCENQVILQVTLALKVCICKIIGWIADIQVPPGVNVIDFETQVKATQKIPLNVCSSPVHFLMFTAVVFATQLA